MKILDRYVLSTFLKNYFIALMVLIGLYVIMDMVFNFDELVEIQAKANEVGMQTVFGLMRDICDYYFYQSFLIFVHLAGIIPVVAAAFTLMRLSRFNELTAMLAAGVPLLRVAMPVIIAALILQGLLFADQELLIPNMIPKLIRKHDEIREGSNKSFRIPAMQDDKNSLLSAAVYTPPRPGEAATMDVMDVTQRDEEYHPVSHISADRAVWDPANRQWLLTNGTIASGLGFDDNAKKREIPIATYQSNITPEEISLYRSHEFVELLSTPRLNDLIRRPKNYGQTDLLRVKHFRATAWMSNMILLLLAIPCVLTREPGRLKQAALKTMVLVGICLAMLFVAQHVAGNPPSPAWAPHWPVMLAWMPIFIFLPVAVILLDRVKS